MPWMSSTARVPEFSKRIKWHGKWWTRETMGRFEMGWSQGFDPVTGKDRIDVFNFLVAERVLPRQRYGTGQFALYTRRI
jgi:hypothetical protein